MRRRAILNLLALAPLGEAARAQFASGRPMRILIGLTAGSSIDSKARAIAPYLGNALNQAILVENKPGANGVISVQELIKAPPDGNTLLLGSLSPLAVNVALMKNLPYDPRRDLTPIAGFFSSNQVLVVRSSLPVRTLLEFVAYAKQHPGKVNIGHATTLIQAQIAALGKMAAIDVLTVPYKGTPPIITDILGGTLDATLLDVGNALPHVKSGALRAIGVTSLKRNPATPDWPAISETLPGFDFPSWTALVGPPGMSRDQVTRIKRSWRTSSSRPRSRCS